MTYDEYDALKAWMIQVGEDGEWPLFLDVWVEHVVEEVANADRKGTRAPSRARTTCPAPRSSRRGHPADARRRGGHPAALPGQVPELDGTPLAGAIVDIWHADDDGFYSQFAPGLPEWNLRGTVVTGDDGRFAIHTIQPAPYQIPTDGSCGKLIAAAGWHAWRPAHLHLKVSAPDHQLITTQLYFEGGEYVERRHRRGREARADAAPRPRAARARARRSPTTSSSTPPDAVRRTHGRRPPARPRPGGARTCWPGRRRTARSSSVGQVGPHLAVVGAYSNLSIFDVADNEELHQLLWNLPLFPYMNINITPLAGHPSDIALAGPDVG